MFTEKYQIEASVNEQMLLEEAARGRQAMAPILARESAVRQSATRTLAHLGAGLGSWMIRAGAQLQRHYEGALGDGLSRRTVEITPEGEPC